MEDISNDATIDALNRIRANGSDLTKPMVIDFFVSTQNEQAGLEIAARAHNQGFETCVEQDDDSDTWTCYCSIRLIPEYNIVVKTERVLQEIANLSGGWLDGFGSFGNAAE